MAPNKCLVAVAEGCLASDQFDPIKGSHWRHVNVTIPGVPYRFALAGVSHVKIPLYPESPQVTRFCV